jgi:replicative DNA helicase
MNIAPTADSAEELIAGQLMSGRASLPDDFVAEAFYSPRLRTVAASMLALQDAGGQHGVEQVAAYLGKSGALEAIGGTPALIGLYVAAKDCAWITPAQAWAQVLDAHATRQVCLAVSGALEQANVLDSDALVGLIYERLGRVKLRREDPTAKIADVIKATVKAMMLRSQSGGLAGVPTGLEKLDDMLGGLAEGVVTIVAGRPSMGKSALARTIADNANAAGFGVHVFSIEDTAETYGMRCLADHARTDLGALRVIGPHTPRNILEATTNAGNRLFQRTGWLVDDSAGLSSADIALRVRKHRAENNTKLVVVDYVQLLREKGSDSKGVEVATAAENLVRLARDERVAVLLLSQLSRKAEERPDKRPQLSDLRETGVLEQIAYAAVLCHRPEFYMADDAPDPQKLRGKGCAIVAKNKNGRTGEAWLQWDSSVATYRNLRGL